MLDMTLVGEIAGHGNAEDLFAVAAKLKIPTAAMRKRLVDEKRKKDQAAADRLKKKAADAKKKKDVAEAKKKKAARLPAAAIVAKAAKAGA